MVEWTHPLHTNQSPPTAVAIVTPMVGLVSLSSGRLGVLRATGGLREQAREQATKLGRTADAG